MNIGDRVKILPPWDNGQGTVYTVVRINADGTVGIDLPGYDDPDYPGADFAREFVEIV